MCTVTYFPHGKESYSLRCSRDESSKRPAAQLPSVRRAQKLLALYPYDTMGDGTWMAVQNDGTCFCMLNGYDKNKTKSRGKKSRAQIIPSLLGHTSESQIRMIMRTKRLATFGPFKLIYVSVLKDRLPKVFTWEWNGTTLNSQHNLIGAQIWSSSETADVQARQYRQHLWKSLLEQNPQPTPEGLRPFHFGTETPSALTPAMKLDDAQTVSVSEVIVNNSGITFNYHPGPPWNNLEFMSYSLARR
ncbi:MAG: NRDE family protein [Verrucomicrobiae bacterium]|nr:NRDE family protein [Verrucomicrobiae bacterium]